MPAITVRFEPPEAGVLDGGVQHGLAGRRYVAPTGKGWLYLAAVLDLATRKVVGWTIRDHTRTQPPAAASTL